MDSVLIDSDVCMDFITGRMPWNPEAAKIFDACESGRISGFVSGLSYSNLFYLLRKHYGGAAITDQLSDLRKLTKISPVTSSGIDWALAAGWTDFEDALQYRGAVESGCKAVITRNLNDYRLAEALPVLSPTDFISIQLS